MAIEQIRDYQSESDVYDHFLEEKADMPELEGLNSTSSVAVWRLWGKVTSRTIWNFRKLLNVFYSEVLHIIKNNQIGRGDWYVTKALEWQYAKQLVYEDNVLKYLEDAPESRIIKRASHQDILHDFNGVPLKETVLKVAKVDGDNHPIPLETADLQAFNQFINQIMFGGSYISTRSEATDYIKIIGDVYYNPLFVEVDVKQAVIENLEGYFANLAFDAVIEKNDLRETIRATEGVDDCELMTVEVRTNSGTYETMQRKYIPYSGFITIADDFDLNNTLTMKTDA